MGPWVRRIAALLVACSTAVALAEDIVVLKSGGRARGKIVEETDEGVRLEIGGGTMFYPRAQIEEVVRDATPKVGDAVARAPAREVLREDHAVLYVGDRRVGTRSLHVLADEERGFRIEETLIWLRETGEELRSVRTIERCGPAFEPLSIQISTQGSEFPELLEGRVVAGTLLLTFSRGSVRDRTRVDLPTSARFGLSAREFFVRESRALGGRLETHVFDPEARRFTPTSFKETGRRRVPQGADVVEVRVIEAGAAGGTRKEWVDTELATRLIQFADGKLRALFATAEEARRVRVSEVQDTTGPASAELTEYVDAKRGFRIGKPDPSWTFEKPVVQGGGALLAVHSAPISASVDVLQDPAPVANTTLERAAEALQRLCRTVASDFRVEREGYARDAPRPYYWLEATATTKGESTRTLARVYVEDDQVFRLLAACPAQWFDGARADLEWILDSFRAK